MRLTLTINDDVATILFPLPEPHGTLVKISTEGLGIGEVINRAVSQLPQATQREALEAGWLGKREDCEDRARAL